MNKTRTITSITKATIDKDALSRATSLLSEIDGFGKLTLEFDIHRDDGQIERTLTEGEEAKKYFESELRIIGSIKIRTANNKIIFSLSRDVTTVSRNAFQKEGIAYGCDKKTITFDLARPDLANNLQKVIEARFPSIEPLDLSETLGQAASNQISAWGSQLTKLETILTDGLKDLEKTRSELETKYNDKQQSLESQYRAKSNKQEDAFIEQQDELEVKYKELEEQLESEYRRRKDKLEEKEKVLALLESKSARRKNREAIFDILEDETRLELSPQTVVRRWYVAFAYLIMIITLGSLAYSVFKLENEASEFNLLLTGQRIAFTLGCVVTVGFLIKWLNNLASRSTEEEFKAKQLTLDMQRASWLVELYFESIDAERQFAEVSSSSTDDQQPPNNSVQHIYEEAFPPGLLERLSRGLFLHGSTEDDSVTPSDAVINAILGASSEAEIDTPTGRLRFGRRGTDKLARDSKK